MECVVDTSVILSILLEESGKAALIAAARDFDLTAPLSLKWEIGNALSSIQKKKRASLSHCLKILKAFNQIPIQYFDPDFETVLALCDKHSIYAYDGYFLVCAKERQLPLFTLDKAMVQIALKEKINILEGAL